MTRGCDIDELGNANAELETHQSHYSAQNIPSIHSSFSSKRCGSPHKSSAPIFLALNCLFPVERDRRKDLSEAGTRIRRPAAHSAHGNRFHRHASGRRRPETAIVFPYNTNSVPTPCVDRRLLSLATESVSMRPSPGEKQLSIDCSFHAPFPWRH
jgi:hypothetical protein